MVVTVVTNVVVKKLTRQSEAAHQKITCYMHMLLNSSCREIDGGLVFWLHYFAYAIILHLMMTIMILILLLLVFVHMFTSHRKFIFSSGDMMFVVSSGLLSSLSLNFFKYIFYIEYLMYSCTRHVRKQKNKKPTKGMTFYETLIQSPWKIHLTFNQTK